MKDIIYVNTGEVKFAKGIGILYSGAIGSCIVITMYDPKSQRGGMAHVMLPGRISKNINEQPTKYAANAVKVLVEYFSRFNVSLDQIETCLVGGGNVLQREDDMVCTNNILSVNEELLKYGVNVNLRATGGILRRTVKFDVEKGTIFFTEGDSQEKLLRQLVQ